MNNLLRLNKLLTYKKLQLAADLFSANQFWVYQRKVRFNFSWKLAYEENVDSVPNFQFNCEEKETQRETERKRKREREQQRQREGICNLNGKLLFGPAKIYFNFFIIIMYISGAAIQVFNFVN